MTVLHHKSPTAPTKAATRPLLPKDKTFAPPVKGTTLAEPALVPAVVEAEIEALVIVVVWEGVDVVVGTATVEDDKDVFEVAAVVNVGASVTDVTGEFWDDDAVGVEALYATVLPLVKPLGSVTLC